ncbi:MAG: hypothetical protein RLZZ127_682 [Planctomycetota bacterium]|jgi:hypothetical protein
MTSRTLLLLLLAVLAAAGEAPGQPRLLFGPAELPTLRARAAEQPYAAILERIRSRADRDGQPWFQSDNAVNCGFLYAITGDDAWAAKARRFLELRLGDTTVHPWTERTKGIDLYMHAKSAALAADLCRGAPSWAGFSATVSQRLLAMGDLLRTHGGSEQNTDPASNWQANRWSAAGLCYLATDEPVPAGRVEACFDRVAAWVAENYGTGAGNRGWSIEGRGYQSFPWSHVGPFAIAARRLAGRSLRDASPSAVDHALWTIPAGACRIVGEFGREFAFHNDFGDDNPNGGSRAEGCWGLGFAFAPKELLPGMVWWYDRMKGAAGDQTWDSARAGAIYSYLYHPGAAVRPQPPLAIPAWREAMADTGGNGMVLFRNRYQDDDDLCAGFYAKLRGNRGHNGPDGLGFRLVGHGTAWATGGGRYGPRIDGVEAYWRSQNGLYLADPSAGPLRDNGERGAFVGTPFIDRRGGGSVVGRMALTNLGVRDHVRRLLADFGPDSGAEGVFVLADTSADGRFWQLCTLATNTVTIDAAGFTITASGGATLRGTVVHPAAPRLATGVRIRGSAAAIDNQKIGENRWITSESTDGDHLVVLTVAGPGKTHPAVRAIAGSGAADARRIAIGRLVVAVAGDAIALAKPGAR